MTLKQVYPQQRWLAETSKRRQDSYPFWYSSQKLPQGEHWGSLHPRLLATQPSLSAECLVLTSDCAMHRLSECQHRLEAETWEDKLSKILQLKTSRQSRPWTRTQRFALNYLALVSLRASGKLHQIVLARESKSLMGQLGAMSSAIQGVGMGFGQPVILNIKKMSTLTTTIVGGKSSPDFIDEAHVIGSHPEDVNVGFLESRLAPAVNTCS